MGDYPRALTLSDSLLAQNPEVAQAWNNDGLLRMDLLELPLAEESFRHALRLDPSNVPAHFNLGLALLMQGCFEDGWREYQWRTRAPGYADYANFPFGIPRWAGQPIAGRSLLVHAEQGFGDTIQFARFLTWASDEGAHVDLFCQPSLRPLLARIRGVRFALSDLTDAPAQDYHLPIIDLGAHFLHSSSVPRWKGPYIFPCRGQVDQWRKKLEALARPRVGLVWSGNVASPAARRRSIGAPRLKSLLASRASFVSLQFQRQESPPGKVFDAAAEIRDWEDTAAVIDNLDLVISVDTAVAHLAAAMGKEAWVMLHFSSDWRWGLEGNTTPWYPCMRLFRQRSMNDWDPVLTDVRDQLEKFVLGATRSQ